MQAHAHSATNPVRSTQSFVHTLTACWRRPSLLARELAWRWACGIPTLLLLAFVTRRIVTVAPIHVTQLQQMSLLDPLAAAVILANTGAVLLPPALHAATWLLPLLAVLWSVGSGIGRTAVLRRADPQLHARPVTLMALYALRLTVLSAVLALWFVCLRADARWSVTDPVIAGAEPNLVLYFAVAIVGTLCLFTLWAVTSWTLSAAPLLAMRRDLGVRASVSAALRMGSLRGKLVEINLVMGIVKIALIVLAMVLSASPLPFETIATPQFMAFWYAGATVLYLVASDLFHVVHLVAYLDLWRANEASAL